MESPPLKVCETRTGGGSCNLLITKTLYWWRRGVGLFRFVKTRKLLKNRRAQKSKNAEIAANWNVSGTPDFSFAAELR
jgi:hypothetical protein